MRSISILFIFVFLNVTTVLAELSHVRIISPGTSMGQALKYLQEQNYVASSFGSNLILAVNKQHHYEVIVKFDESGKVYEEQFVMPNTEENRNLFSKNVKQYVSDNGKYYECGELHALWYDGNYYVAIIGSEDFIIYYYSLYHPQYILSSYLLPAKN